MAQTSRATVLIVEAGDTLADFAKECLPSEVVVERVAEGIDGLRYALSHPVAVAIVDADLDLQPDGPETIYWLRRLLGIHVIAVSARGDAEMRLRIAAASPDAFLVRPLNFGELYALISTIVARQRQSPPWSSAAAAGLEGSPEVKNNQLPAGFMNLTGREWQVILDFVDTPNAQAVAAKRGRSPHTVHNQLKSIFRKLGVHSLPELLSLLLRVGRSPQ